MNDALALRQDPIAVATETIVARTLRFGAVLRGAGLAVTPARIMDLLRALPCVDLLNADSVRLSMRVNIATSRDEERLFDRIFDAYWRDRTPPERLPSEIELEPRPDDENKEHPEALEDQLGSPAQWSNDEAPRELDLVARLAPEPSPVDDLLRLLIAKLATRPSRRTRPAAKGSRIDLRRSLRRNAGAGGDVIDLAYARRRIRKTRVVFLCDVSGSMDTYNPFLLQLLFGLQKRLKNSRSVVFSTRATEITAMLRRQSVAQILREISEGVQHWSGGTDIGAALATFNRKILCEGTPSSTVAIILSDGYDQGDPEIVAREMESLGRRVRSVVWINPLIGSEGYQPIAKGMRAALPHVDHFLPANDIPSLYALCKRLGTV